MSDDGDKRPPGRLARLISTGRLERAAPAPPPPASLDRNADLQRALRRAERAAAARPLPPTDPRPLEEILALLDPPPVLRREETEQGRVTTLTWRHPVDATHGVRRHAEALALPCADIAAILRDERLHDFDVRRTLFVDIESTGLSHGAGTYAFLVGLAWFEDDELVVQELFLEDPSDEAALLTRFAELRASRPYLVSFNGRCYDVHVLQSRLVLNRVYDAPESELLLTPHIDLLHLSRPVYKGCHENGRLQTLEREVLAVQRHGDVPGELIPSLYFAYLTNTDTAPLTPVFRHNAIDVLSMVALLSHLGAVLRAEPAALPAPVAANLGALWLARKRPRRALSALAAATERLDGSARAQAREHEVLARKRCLSPAPAPEDLTALRLALEDWAALAPDSAQPHEELSRLHERRTRDLARALLHAQHALSRLPASATRAERELAERRVSRIHARIHRVP